MTGTDVELIASRMSRGLTALAIPNAVYRLGTPVPIPAEECDEGLGSYQRWMESKGWRVTIDRARPFMSEELMAGVPDLFAGRSDEEIRADAERSHQALEWLVGYWTPKPQLMFASDDMKVAFGTGGARIQPARH